MGACSLAAFGQGVLEYLGQMYSQSTPRLILGQEPYQETYTDIGAVWSTDAPPVARQAVWDETPAQYGARMSFQSPDGPQA